MARVVVQFVASSNMSAAVSKDIATINAQLAALQAKIAAVGATDPGQLRQLNKNFAQSVAQMGGYTTATMSARTATQKLTDDIRTQKTQLKDLAAVQKALPQMAQQQMALRGSSAMITGLDASTGRAMGQLVTPTTNFGQSAALAAMQAGIMGKAIQAAGQNTVAAGKKMQWTGRQLSTGLTAPIVALAAVSAKAAYDIDAAMVRLTKVYGDLGGATEAELQDVRDATTKTAEEVASSFGIAGKATVQLAADLAAAGYQGRDLQENVREIQRISLLGELDQQKAMQASRTIQTVYGISTEELANKFNFLNAVENQTSTTLQDLTEVIPRTAGVIKDLGGSLEDSAIFTVAFKEAGIDAVQGANALRSSLGAIVAPSGVAQKRLKALGIDIRKIAAENNPENGGKGLTAMLQQLGGELDNLSNLERQEALAVLFGRYQFNKMGGLLKGLAENANDAGTQVGRAFELASASPVELAAVADRELKAIQESLSGRLRRVGATVTMTFADFGKPVLAFFVTIAEAVSGVLSVLNMLPGPIKGLLGIVAGFAALAGPFLFFRGIFKVLFGSLMTLRGGAMAAKSGFDGIITAEQRFAQLASTVVMPAIAAQTGAIERLGAAMIVTGRAATAMASQVATAGRSGAAGVVRMAPATNMAQAQAQAAARARNAPVLPPMLGRPAAIPPVSPAVEQSANRATAAMQRLKASMMSVSGAMMGISIVGLMFANNLNDGAAKVVTTLLTITLVLSMFPALLAKIALAVKGLGMASMWAAIIPNIRNVVVAINMARAGTIAWSGAFYALRVAMMAALGPLALLVAGIGVAIVMWRRHQKSIQEQQKDTMALQGAAESLASTVGFEYARAGKASIDSSDKTSKSLKDQAAEWIKTGDTAKRVSRQIRMASAESDEEAREIAKNIGLDARAHGASAEAAMEAARVALASGGFSGIEAMQFFPDSEEFESVKYALKKELDSLGTALGNAVVNGSNKGDKYDQVLQDLGAKVAARLNTQDKQEIFKQMDIIGLEASDRLSDAFKFKDFDKKDMSFFKEMNLLGPDGEVTGDMERLRKFFEVELPALRKLNKGDEGYVDVDSVDGLFDLKDAFNEATTAEMRMVDAMKTALGVQREGNERIDTMAELMDYLASGTVRVSEAEAEYVRILKTATVFGKNLTDVQKLEILNNQRLAAGLPTTTKLTDMFGAATDYAAQQVDKLSGIMGEVAGTSDQYADGIRGFLSTGLDDVIGEMLDQYDKTTDAGVESIETQADAWENGFQNRKEAAEASYEAQEKAADKAWDKEEKSLDARFDKQIEDAEKAKDARIQAIEDEMDKADKLDEKRKNMFEAEMTRLERLNNAANANIDYNVALKGGDLDEAQRILETAYVDSVSNQVEDANSGMDTNAQVRRTAGEGQIAAIEESESIRIKGIEAAQQKEREAFAERRDLAKTEMAQRKADMDTRLKMEQDGHRKQVDSQKAAYQANRAERRAVTEETLKQLAIEVPTTQAAYRTLMDTMKKSFQDATGSNFEETRKWNELHRGGFKVAMENTHKELRNAKAWQETGKKAVDEMIQGMLGMSFAEFATWMETGNLPAAPKQAAAAAGSPGPMTTNTYRPANSAGGTQARHSGGPVDSSMGSRAGRPMNAPLYPDEVPTILQKGEYVMQRSAVDNLGAATLDRLNNGQASFFHEGGLIGAAGAKIMSTFQPAMTAAISAGARRKTQELQAAGKYDQIPEALQMMTTAATAGKYGGADFNAEQLANAATIIGVGRKMGATERDLIIALMTAMQESMLRNITHGDRDSVGLFQQRTSQGWGSIEQIMNPTYSATKFFEALLKVKGREDMAPTRAAQAVQRSAFPDAYAKWQDEAEAILAGTGAGATGGTAGYNGRGAFQAFGGTVTGDIQGLQVEFLNRLARWSASLGQAYNVGSGYRSMAEQQILYDRYMAGVPGQAKAAPPGRSNHNFGLASDGPHWRGRNPGAFGLTYPMSYEPWHIEPIGAKGMRVPQLATGGTVRYDDTIANLHKNETVLTAPLSKSLEKGIAQLDSGTSNMYNININGSGLSSDEIANKVIQKIERREQVRGPRRTIS